MKKCWVNKLWLHYSDYKEKNQDLKSFTVPTKKVNYNFRDEQLYFFPGSSVTHLFNLCCLDFVVLATFFIFNLDYMFLHSLGISFCYSFMQQLSIQTSFDSVSRIQCAQSKWIIQDKLQHRLCYFVLIPHEPVHKSNIFC